MYICKYMEYTIGGLACCEPASMNISTTWGSSLMRCSRSTKAGLFSLLQLKKAKEGSEVCYKDAPYSIPIYLYLYVCMYICMYVRMYVCMYVRMYVCMYLSMCVEIDRDREIER